MAHPRALASENGHVLLDAHGTLPRREGTKAVMHCAAQLTNDTQQADKGRQEARASK